MKSNYLHEYANLLERVLSTAYENNYADSAVERAISYSPFFQKVERDNNLLAPIINDYSLIKELFPDLKIELDSIPVYSQCLWAAESYLRIQEATKLTFEAIFTYIPISFMYSYHKMYHEMDFSQIVDEFMNKYNKECVLSLLTKKYKYSYTYISEKTGIPCNTLYSLSQRTRDISKMSIDKVNALATLFNVRIETISELKIL